jgi:hypothetical protein
MSKHTIRHVVAGALLALTCVRPVPTDAQNSRAEVIAAEQSAKAKQLRPHEPSTAEKVSIKVHDVLTQMQNGFYANVGSVYSGGGFALGPGYRRFYGDRSLLDVKGLYSIRSYKLVEIGTQSPGHAEGLLDLYARAAWRDATQVAFYGLGTDSAKDGRTNFRMKQASASGGFRVRPLSWVVAGGALSYEDFTLEDGSGVAPSIEELYTPQTAPGLGGNPAYLHTTLSAGIDWRPSPGYARRGGLYAIDYHNYADRDSTYSFDRIDGEVVQHIPILRENWVLSLRGHVQTTVDDKDLVPYFLLPALGSGSTLRAYSSWRFHDRHSELFSVEWRWIPNRFGLDMAFFYDAGKVTSRRSDLDLTGLKSNVGVGARFHGPAATPLRIEVARGREGLHLVFAAGPAF